jgi:acyl-homoserine lactone acylase PvdQ
VKRAFGIACVGLAVFAAASAAAPAPGGYQQDDGKGFSNILPPGQVGLDNVLQLGQFLSSKTYPPHSDEQLPMYGNLVYAAPGLSAQDMSKYFKDASFGIKTEDIERTYSPRGDVTIVRDKQFGVPRIYGTDRNAVEFGAGYVAGEDRLFFIDVLRHLGRAQLTSFAGGAKGNQQFDETQWAVAPYTEADLQKQIDQLPVLYGSDGQRVIDGIENYTAGVNAYIAAAKLNPNLMPGEYAAINQPQGPADWKDTDVIAIASLVGAIFGKGGGGEVRNAEIYQGLRKRFGKKLGTKLYRELRSAEDREAPVTTDRSKVFRYEAQPRKAVKGSMALPDAGTLEYEAIKAGGTGSGAGTGSTSPSLAGGLGFLKMPSKMSNELVVSARESATGRPLAVFGPQTGYFAPQILMEQEMHAPNMDSRGVSFPGTNLIVQLGRGRDYAWSATSAGQDIIDTFALPLCDPAGGQAKLDSKGYDWQGSCHAFESVERTNSWTPSPADQTPPGTEKLVALRTPLGIVTARSMVGGKPVAYTRLRSTYAHELDSALGFIFLNDPQSIKGPQDAINAFSKIGYTFNWFYVDSKHTAYFNSGNNPLRPRGLDTDFPVWGKPQFVWKGFDGTNNTARYTPASQHPQQIDKAYFANWNNKQATGYRAADDNWSYTSLYRSLRLEDRIKAGIKGKKKMTLTQLANAMEDGGTVDLRGAYVLPWALKVIGKPKDAKLAAAVAKLRAWVKGGAHRRDLNKDGKYDDADAVRIMDAWWPLWVEAEFMPALGSDAYKLIEAQMGGIDNAPNNHGDHLGSAYQYGFYGYAQKDLRNVLGGKTRKAIKGRYSRVFCGGTNRRQGTLRRCRGVLLSTLATAEPATADELYGGDAVCRGSERGSMDLQMCFDAVRMRPLGAITHPLIPWIDRPTFQQAVEVQGSVGR